MNIINNRTKDNHESILIDCFESSDEIWLVSPFLSKSFSFFPFEKVRHLRKITLLTTLKPFNSDQHCKVRFFKDLFIFGNTENVDIEILIDNSLHGKMYIGKKENVYIKAIITSSNFTRNGLKINNEWGVCFDDHSKIKQIVNNLRKHVILKPITEKTVDKFQKIIDKNPLKQNEQKSNVNLIEEITFKENPLNILAGANYWLKPIGVSDNIITWGRAFDEITSDLHFSNKRPSGVKIGDILIAYAVGHKNILSIYRVISDIKYTGNPNNRWPYYVIGENLTPYYGKDWNQYDITVSNQKNEVLNKKLFDITPSGKNSYVSLESVKKDMKRFR